jgi:hypothetical protein
MAPNHWGARFRCDMDHKEFFRVAGIYNIVS